MKLTLIQLLVMHCENLLYTKMKTVEVKIKFQGKNNLLDYFCFVTYS